MRILIVGNGGREHALLWKLQQDAPGAEFFATRPNGGMASLATAVEIAPTDVEALAGWAAAQRIDLTVVGPEAPLAMGIADRFKKVGLPVFGPSRAAARIESSKAFAKDLMQQAGVPTADYRVFTELPEAEAYLAEVGAPIVVKASGLAAGKGAVVCDTEEEALSAVRSMLGDLAFGEAGREVVIEECMTGEELSVFGIADGENVITFLPAQDHKRLGEGDTGPNTGGMGAYAPVGISSESLEARIRRTVFHPTLEALRAAGAPFTGLLYAGLMLTPEGPKVVEFNCRFGDPETQALLPLLDGSLLEPLYTVATGGRLAKGGLVWRAGAAVNTVLASGGYPGSYDTGKTIDIPAHLQAREDVLVFHAGTTLDGDRLTTSGGRVLSVTGLASDVEAAGVVSREAAEQIRFDGCYYRRDIAQREVHR
jgi:phosphoribosylamine--glycine ligase